MDWWYFTETTLTDFLPLFASQEVSMQENQSYLRPVTPICLFEVIKGSFKFTVNLFDHIAIASDAICSKLFTMVENIMAQKNPYLHLRLKPTEQCLPYVAPVVPILLEKKMSAGEMMELRAV